MCGWPQHFIEKETGKGHTLVQSHATCKWQSWDLNLGCLTLTPLLLVSTFSVCVCVCVCARARVHAHILNSLQISPRGPGTNLGHLLRPSLPDPQPPPSPIVSDFSCRFGSSGRGSLWPPMIQGPEKVPSPAPFCFHLGSSPAGEQRSELFRPSPGPS